MKFASPAIYAWLYNDSKTDQYRNMLMQWLEWENPELHKLVVKELGHGDRDGRANPEKQSRKAKK